MLRNLLVGAPASVRVFNVGECYGNTNQGYDRHPTECVAGIWYFVSISLNKIFTQIYMLRIYGIKNCDTMKKAFDWLKAKKISYEFHDYKTEGLSEEKVQEWLKKSAPELVANTRSTTWKALTDEQKATLNNPNKLSKVLTENTSAVKRPLIEYKNEIMMGFDAVLWEKKLM